MLGSTRFMKTILCKLPSEGQMVLHVFMRPVSMNFDLTRQIKTLRRLYSKLKDTKRVLAHIRVLSDDWAVYILRQYLHNNLYDKASTRPFLSPAEKRWIAYQILTALRESHARGVCHGDIKSENIMVTSWNLAFLADFAPFKPTYLPADDPAEFNFYFDTSARQCCCVSPERFYDPGSKISQVLVASNADMVKESADSEDKDVLALKPSMDIFSAGCVIAELFLDGNPLFSLSRLLQYRKGDITTEELVSGIHDPEIAALVSHMIQIEPEARLSAAEYLDRWASIFPNAPLAAYMDSCSPDTRMRTLFGEIGRISDDTCEIFASVSCANVRNCNLPSSRCMGIKVLLKCSRGPLKGDPDLILPYFVALTADSSAQVRALAIVAIRDLLLDLNRLTPINANIFDDYLAPHLQYYAGDSSVGVRCIFASVISDIADSSYYLVGGDLHTPSAAVMSGSLVRRTDFLDNQIRAVVSKLSFDEAEVKHVLLCSFPQLYERGVQSLSHIITYLNDRDCWFLRAAFFDVVFAASGQISRHASREYIVPLINLNDHEVFVAISALRALIKLVPQMSPAMLWDKLVEAQALSKHPALRSSAKEFTEFVVGNARLPISHDLVGLALDITKTNAGGGKAVEIPASLTNEAADKTSARTIQLREIGAALQTVFLTPVKDPWTSKAHIAKGKMEAFMHKKSLELEFAQTLKQQKFEEWRPHGTLVAEIVEHNDAVSCLVATGGSLFASGGDDGVVRLFDANSFRKNAVCRSRATHFQGGRITGLVYHSVLDCLVSSSDNGSIHVYRPASHEFVDLAPETVLPKHEYIVGMGFAKGTTGVSLVAGTSRSRVLFYDIATMKLEDEIVLRPAYGRLTAMVSESSVFAVIGTSEGILVLIDSRFRIELKRFRHFLGHQITSLSMYKNDSILVGTAAGDVCVLDLRTGKWPVCVCSRSLQELKGNDINRRLRINSIEHVEKMAHFVAGSNDSMLRFWDLKNLERSYVINSSEAGTPYSSYRLNDTVYYCENAAPAVPRSPLGRASNRLALDASNAISSNNGKSGGPITSMAILGTPSIMLVTGLQSGAIRVMI
ncbi:Serine/threonine-protein kinase [Coemansia sp. RSA 1813]|nr:Serine/threonine-protein kinase [Coemansia sp. RSA 1646]KAJ1772993.1 Serine/threonine-protein kinase [Coemansia sp. RSA 1843]KAJ2092230.1 Serine/threonine-protein kinase [Coemansia sp. RSA 986]KAJ2211348.1 Serine/threonine-protein kinase [Coemansia sp. RSA 487]KAJ2570296.1 Serine/threonine-protein kinase [Coemansia sp. RSA 1813]